MLICSTAAILLTPCEMSVLEIRTETVTMCQRVSLIELFGHSFLHLVRKTGECQIGTELISAQQQWHT